MAEEEPGTAEAQNEAKGAKSPANKKLIIFAILVFVLLLIAVNGVLFLRFRQPSQPVTEEVSPTPTETLTPTPEVSPSPSPTPIPTKKPTPTPTPTPSPTPSPTPTPIPQADLYISKYSFDHPPKQGEAFTVTIGISNKGNKDAGGFWWEWKATWAITACRERIDSLATGSERIVTCTYTYGGWANYETKAIADANNEVPESDEGNNTYTQNVTPIH